MTMALAVAMVACSGAVGKAGEAGEAGDDGATGKDGAPGGVTPIAVLSIAAVELTLAAAPAEGEAATVVSENIADLSKYFHDGDGQTLSYHPKSSKATVATAKVVTSTGTPATMDLLITAVAAGKATVSVYAMDVDGLKSPSHKVMVTVKAAGTTEPPTTTPPTTTPPTGGETPEKTEPDAKLDVGRIFRIAKTATQTAEVDGTAVEITSQTTTEVVVTAVAKGTARVLIYDANVVVPSIIYTIKVNNRAPTRNMTMTKRGGYGVAAVSSGGADDTTLTQHLADSDAATNYYKVALPYGGLNTFFTDPDKEALTYTVASASPRDVVVLAYNKTGSAIYLDIVRYPSGGTVNLTVTAKDKEMQADKTLSLPVRFDTNTVVPRDYIVGQLVDGTFVPPPVERRNGTHKFHLRLRWIYVRRRR